MSFSPLQDGFPFLGLPSSGELAWHPPAQHVSRSAAELFRVALFTLFCAEHGRIPLHSMCVAADSSAQEEVRQPVVETCTPICPCSLAGRLCQ